LQETFSAILGRGEVRDAVCGALLGEMMTLVHEAWRDFEMLHCPTKPNVS